MERTVGAYEAKTHLSALLDDVQRGEVITITRRGVPVARLEPIAVDAMTNNRRVVERLRELQKELGLPKVSSEEIVAWVREGRDR